MPKLSPEQMASRRQQILDAALACFAERGVDGTSMRDIEARSGISRGGLYVHFETKEALVQGVFDLLRQHSAPHVSEADGPPTLDQVIQRSFAVFRHPEREPRLALDAELKAQLLRNPALLESRRADYRFVVGALAEVVQREQAEGRLDPELDARLTAQVLLAIQEGTKQTVSFADEDFDLDRYLATVRRLLGL